MRTSRVSRDTSRIIAASRTQRPLRRARAGASATRDSALNAIEAGGVTRARDPDSVSTRPGDAHSDSGLSSAPEDSVSSEGSDAAMESRKRKRGQNTPVTIKYESKEMSTATVASSESAAKPKKARRVPAKKRVAADGSVRIEPPPNWQEMYALTREMRNENIAPVDTMGCESLADSNMSPRDQRFQTLVALMLSSQTKDTVTSVAIRSMQQNMPGGFNLESVLALDPPALNAFINKVGFHNQKTKYIKQAAGILRDKWNSDIPDTIPGLVSLPGVGPKMAYLCLSAAWGKDEGIGVDVHVHRITNLWGWHKTKSPEETRAALESWLPRDKWHDINNLLVGFGQTICLPVSRRCGECKLADRGLCPSAVVAKSSKVKKEEVAVKTGGPGGETVVESKLGIAQEDDTTAKNVEGAMPDIEDMGKAPRRTRRGRAL